jgi:hypothetical protein
LFILFLPQTPLRALRLGESLFVFFLLLRHQDRQVIHEEIIF